MIAPSVSLDRSASPQPDHDYPESVQSSQSRSDNTSTRSVLWRLYVSHTLSTWNARMFEFGAVLFLAAIFPGTLFFASLYALFRSAVATVFSSWIGSLVDRKSRLRVVRHSIIWQRCSVAASCLLLLAMLQGISSRPVSLACFSISVALAGVEKLAFVANTVSVERDWIIVVSDSLEVERQNLNSAMRRIDLICKLVAPLGIALIESFSTKTALWVVFGQNAISVVVEYLAIAQVYAAIPQLADKDHDRSILQRRRTLSTTERQAPQEYQPIAPTSHGCLAYATETVRPWLDYVRNPAFLASFSLSLLYLTVLSFGSQMTTYLLTIGFTSLNVSVMRLVAVALELSATCAAPALMRKIGAVRSGLWFINEQLMSIALAIGLFSSLNSQSKLAGGALIIGVSLSRLGLWGFDLCVQYLVQEDAPEGSRGSFSAIEMALQNLFELISFATTMIFYRPEDFKYPIYISAGAIALSAACFAGFVRRKRGHLLHTSKCLKRSDKTKYNVLPTIEEEPEELDDSGQNSSS
ncbi:hypothetical protein BS50DRAFT_569285 [Corynespora cassiicola Philippines]|uniref:Solute carrier family 40 member n=1 Tax=Corynespora cassiicola Philippines TaxID=1448308 RepID=A0A2T2P293_CORCC|nr:hypothetical protein BS50DRAFT_569285 [Corynespora cassiicola Philippines]